MILREVVHAHFPMLGPESTVRDAVAKMELYQFPALVVVDAAFAPLAVVTEGDLCRAVTSKASLVQLADEPAMIYASRTPTTAGPETEISDALHRMLMSGLTLLPVVADGRTIGVVFRADLMHAMLLDAEPDAALKELP